MTTLHNVGASVEAEKSAVKARKIVPQLPVKDMRLGSLVYRFIFERNSSVEILEELSPRVHKVKDTSLLAVGDNISGLSISGFSVAPIPSPVIKKGSATHKANFLSCHGFLFAEIKYAFPGYK